MPPKFGTSGLRGRVSDLTPALIADYIRAFVMSCPTGQGLWVGHDLRPSSAALADQVARVAMAQGIDVHECGAVPTPALALAALTGAGAAVMVTGSHIPADRNGLKFYTPKGEITKAEEAAILSARGRDTGPTGQIGQRIPTDALTAYAARYTHAYAGQLTGRRIGLWAQSAVGRDLLAQVLRDCGAVVTELDQQEAFVPVDTEALPDSLRAHLRDWAADGYDAIVSTDADGDRPLVTDQHGDIIPGDVLGQIAGRALGARVAVTPVSSNTCAEAAFGRVIRTRIGSPYVIAGLDGQARAVGYEANGGFILTFAAEGPMGPVAPLWTRDAVLPILAALAVGGTDMAGCAAATSDRFTAADRLQDVPTAQSAALVAELSDRAPARAMLLAQLALKEATVDLTDGLRIMAEDGRILHLRPSGNAPELRIYTEADSRHAAAALLAETRAVIAARLGL